MENNSKSEHKEELKKLKESKSALKSILKKIKSKNNIMDIQKRLRKLIIHFLDRYNILYSDNDLENLSNIATVDYLVAWLDNDKSLRQSIRAFLDQKYTSESINSNDVEKYDRMVENLERKSYNMNYNKHIIEFDHIIRARQSKESNSKHKRIPYKLNSKQKYCCTDLNFLDLYTNGELKLYDIIYYNQEKNTHKKSIETFKNAYEKYNMILKRLESIKSPNEFTITFFNLYKLEISNHFILKAKLASFLCYNAIDINVTIPDYLTYSFLPHVYPKLQLHNNLPSFAVNLSNQIINHKMIINQAYQGYATDQLFMEMYKKRVIISYAITLYNLIFPVSKRKSWTEKDFKNTVYFLKNDYNLFEAFGPLDLSTPNNSDLDFYEYLLRVYNDPCFVTDFEELKRIRQELQQLLKDYKKKKKNNH